MEKGWCAWSMVLFGIGPATAKRIIRNRPYTSTAELSRAEVAGPIIGLIGSR